MTPPVTPPACDERRPCLDENERAELEALRDFRQAAFIGDDGSVVIRPWDDLHRRHADEPYIGCPFCRDQFISRSEHKAALAAARQVDEATVERATEAAWENLRQRTGADYNVALWDGLGQREQDAWRSDTRAALLAALTVPEPEEGS